MVLASCPAGCQIRRRDRLKPERRVRILLLNYEYPPLGGGAGVATAELAQGLAGKGSIVHVVTAQGPEQQGRANPARIVRHKARDGLVVYRVRSRRKGIHQAGYGGAAAYLKAALPVVRRLTRTWQYDIAHLFFSLPTGAILPFAGLGGTPVVVSLRGSDVPGYDPAKRSLQIAHSLLLPVTRWIWKRADRVVAVCGALGQLAERADPGRSFSVIRNGVDLQLFRPAVNGRGSPSGRIRCIAVARLVERKGIADLLHAWCLLERDRFSLEIVGSGSAEAKFRELAESMGLDREVQFVGPMSREQVAERYRQVDLFTLPPLSEAFGNVFAEAMASGLPIVGTNVGGIPELVKDGVNGLLVRPGDCRALADAIARLASDETLRRNMAERNRADAERGLSWDLATDRYMQLYDDVLAGVPPGQKY